MNTIWKMTIYCSASLVISANAQCAQPALSPSQLQAEQAHNYPTDKSVVFGATLNALQDEGFSISSADVASGFISAESVSTVKTNFWDAMASVAASGNTRATIVIEGFSPISTRVRISLVSTKNMSGSLGQATREDRPIAMAQPYRELFAKLDAGVSFRIGQISKPANAYIDRSSLVPIAELGSPVVASTAMPPPQILAAAKAQLLQDGYQVIAYDEAGGFLATGPKPSHLTPDMADCGRVLGISYLRDKRAATDTQVAVEAKAGSISVRVAVNGIYRTGYGNPDKALTCKSRGVIEADLLEKIGR